MSDEMTRDDLLTLMRAWGWRLTDTVPGAWRLDVWTHPNGMDEALVPVDQRAAGYARHLRKAEVDFAHAEAPRLLAVVREVAALHRPVPDGQGFTDDSYGTISPACGTCGTHGEYAEPWPCPTASALEALTDTTEGHEGGEGA